MSTIGKSTSGSAVTNLETELSAPAQSDVPQRPSTEKQPRRLLNLHFCILLIAVVFFVGYKLPLLGNASDDRNLVSTFDSDELSAIKTIERGINNGLDTEFYFYGNVYPLVTIASLLPFTLTDTLNDQTIIIALRTMSLLATVLSVFMLFQLGRKFLSPTAGLIAALLLLHTAEINAYSTIAHSDTLQILLVIICLYYCMEFVTRKNASALSGERQENLGLTFKSYLSSRRYLLAAACFAGLAFGTKYVGIFVLPTIALASWLANGQRLAQWKMLFYDFLSVASVFVLAFVVTNPYHVINHEQFIYCIKTTVFWVTEAFLYKLDPNPFLWFDIFKSTEIMGPPLFFLIAASIVFCTIKTYNLMVRRELFKKQDVSLLLLCCWMLTFFAYIFIRIRYRQARYVLPLIPFAYLVFAFTLTSLLARINNKSRALGIVACLAVVAAAPFALKANFARAAEFKADILSRSDSVAINAGIWLKSKYPANTVILFDMYSYIPASFTRTTHTWGLYEAQLQEVNPQVIIVNSSISNRFADPELAKEYEDGRERGLEIHAIYKSLVEGTRPGFVLEKDFGDVKIYTRR